MWIKGCPWLWVSWFLWSLVFSGSCWAWIKAFKKLLVHRDPSEIISLQGWSGAKIWKCLLGSHWVLPITHSLPGGRVENSIDFRTVPLTSFCAPWGNTSGRTSLVADGVKYFTWLHHLLTYLCDNCQLDGIYSCHENTSLGMLLEVSLVSSSHKVKNSERRERQSGEGVEFACQLLW